MTEVLTDSLKLTRMYTQHTRGTTLLITTDVHARHAGRLINIDVCFRGTGPFIKTDVHARNGRPLINIDVCPRSAGPLINTGCSSQAALKH